MNRLKFSIAKFVVSASGYAGLGAAIALTTSLVACGGGGSDGSQVTAVPVKQAIIYAYTNGLQKTLNVTGTANSGSTSMPITGTLTFTLGKASSTTFNGVPALQSTATVTGSMSVNGQTAPFNSSATNYLTATYDPIGSSDSTSYCVSSTTTGYPTSSSVGQTGNIGSSTCYTNSSKTVRVGTETVSYVTSAGSLANSLDVKVISNIYMTSNQFSASGATTYTVSSAGLPSLTRWEMVGTMNGVTISIVGQ